MHLAQEVFQCPLGLIPHFYRVDVIKSMYFPDIECQCPLGLIPHFYKLHAQDMGKKDNYGVNALSGLYLISTALAIMIVLNIRYRVNALSGLYLISTSKQCLSILG